ncbi:MAG TPA: SDR family oxidoreductase [Gemmatimonadaceae bacterium]|nr:SDR family oxidoreductase [Gemmatimonadaceae bacterium]
MDLGLSGRCVVVTGSSRGIGLEIAREFLKEGARVTITGRDEARLQAAAAALAPHGDAVALTADFAAGEREVRRVLVTAKERMGGLNIIVANVGSGAGKPGLDADEKEWHRILGENLMSAVVTTREAVALMPGNGGAVVLISSIAGIEALAAPIAYSTAKAGVIALGKTLSRELGSRGIRVNVVSPGNVLHPGGSWEKKRAADPPGVDSYIKAEVPLGRFGMPIDIASAVMFLASDKAAGFVTGANLVVDGGQTRAI